MKADDHFDPEQLIINEGLEQADLLDVLLDASLIGLHAVERVRGLIRQTPRDFKMKHRLYSQAEGLMRYTSLKDVIETFWLKPKNRHAASWMEHRDINRVMLATSLAPDGYLSL